MENNEDFFVPEQLEDQLDRVYRAQDVPQNTPPTDSEFLLALDEHYQQEKAQDATSLERAWERIAEIESREYSSYAFEKLQPGKTFSMRTARKRAWLLLAIVALLVAATGGGVAVLALGASVHVTRSVAVGAPVLVPPNSGQSAIPTPIPTSVAPQSNIPLEKKTAIFTHVQATWGINSLDWSPDGTRVLSANTLLQAWDATNGHHLMTFEHADGHSYPFLVAKWSPDGTRIAAASDDVEIWNASTGHSVLTMNYQSIAASQNSLVSPLAIRNAGVYHARTDVLNTTMSLAPESPSHAYSGGGNSIFALAWSPDGKYIAATSQLMGGQNASLLIWDATSGKLVSTRSGSPASSIAWSPNGKYIAFTSGSNVTVVKALSTESINTYGNVSGNALLGVAWASDSERYAVYASDGTVSIHDGLTGQIGSIFQGEGTQHVAIYAASPIAWSHSDKQIAVVGDEVKVWNVATGELLYTYTAQTQAVCSGSEAPPQLSGGSYNAYSPCVNAVAWSPNGTYIASGDGPGSGTQPTRVEVWQIFKN